MEVKRVFYRARKADFQTETLSEMEAMRMASNGWEVVIVTVTEKSEPLILLEAA